MLDSYISKVSYAGNGNSDFIEVVLPAGTDTTGYYLELYQESSGNSYLTMAFPPVTTTIAGNDVYLFNKASIGNFPSAMRDGEGIALVDGTGTVLHFVSHGSGSFTALDGAAAGLTSQYMGSATGNGTGLVTNDGGDTYMVTGTLTPGSVACLAEGTPIRTLDGYVPIERLKPGTLLPTWSAGLQQLRIVRFRNETYTAQTPDAMRPVLIPPKIFGGSGFDRPLVVSPNHRIPRIVGKDRQVRLFPAKTLVGWRGIRAMRGLRQVRWVHLGLPVHAVIESGGLLTESLLPGPMVERSLSSLERRAWSPIDSDPCFPLVRPKEARALLGKGAEVPLPHKMPFGVLTSSDHASDGSVLPQKPQGRAERQNRALLLN